MIDEEVIEAAFWAFDEERKRSGAERDAFKHQVRRLLLAHLMPAQALIVEAETYVRAYKTGFDAPQGKAGASRCLGKIGAFLKESPHA